MMSGMRPIPRRMRVAMIRPTLPELLLSRIVIMPPTNRTLWRTDQSLREWCFLGLLTQRKWKQRNPSPSKNNNQPLFRLEVSLLGDLVGQTRNDSSSYLHSGSFRFIAMQYKHRQRCNWYVKNNLRNGHSRVRVQHFDALMFSIMCRIWRQQQLEDSMSVQKKGGIETPWGVEQVSFKLRRYLVIACRWENKSGRREGICKLNLMEGTTSSHVYLNINLAAATTHLPGSRSCPW